MPSPISRECTDDQRIANTLTQADSVFSGISTFGRLPYQPCLQNPDALYNIAFIGAPFDTGTSYRPGARFGPSGIRQGSRRLNL
jgi:agmatinase